MNRKTWAGVFGCERSSVRSGERNWVITSLREPIVEITLLGADVDARVVSNGVQRVTIDWLSEGATVDLISGLDVFRIHAATVLVHEPLPTLYRALPLADFDARARRFWQRVFWLARLPGGRTLLRLLARRARA
jgi:hypothetical protein